MCYFVNYLQNEFEKKLVKEARFTNILDLDCDFSEYAKVAQSFDLADGFEFIHFSELKLIMSIACQQVDIINLSFEKGRRHIEISDYL